MAAFEPLPCPFCGGEVRIEQFSDFDMQSGNWTYEWAFLHSCPPMGKHRNVHGMGDGAMVIESAYFETREDAIAAWNRRAEA